jgi:predicted TIM-barrel fold metal-dependent hydrolase
LPDWEEDVRRCHEDLRMPGIRLHPNYHGYRLNDPAFLRLLAVARERRLLVQLVVTMEDERTQNPVFRVSHVDVTPLAAAVRTVPGLRLILLNAFRSVSLEQAGVLAAAGQVCFDLAMLEGSAGVGRLIDTVGAERVLFGSHFPLFVLESALLKLREAELPVPLRDRIAAENAGRQLNR